jgi:PPP family 3-phenylpropionic acid transporter
MTAIDNAPAHNSRFPGVTFYCKVVFFCYFGFLSTYAPFVPLLLSSAGGNQVEIGLISAFQPFIGIVSMPAFGFFADKLGRHTLLLSVLIILTSLLRLSILLASSLTAVATLVLISEFSGNPVCSIIDSTVLDNLPDPLLYGHQRLWGTIGWGILAPLAGVVMTAASGPAAALWVHAFGNLLVLAAASRFRIARPPAPAVGAAGAAWRAALRDAQTVAFVLGTIVMGQAYGAIGAFLFLRLEQLGGSTLLMGLTLAVNCAVEAPMFHFSAPVIRRLGLVGVLVLCLSLMAVRLAFYGVLETPWPVLVVEGIHGVTFALLWAAGTVKTQRRPSSLPVSTFICLAIAHCLQSLRSSLLFSSFPSYPPSPPPPPPPLHLLILPTKFTHH